MQDATDFGKILRGLMVRNNLRQVELAKELEVSPAILSNYLIGKNIPEMDFLAKCVKRFDLKKKELSEFYYSAFLISAETRYEIVFNTQHIDSTRIDMLVKFLTALELYPTMPNGGNENKEIVELRFKIDECYKALGEDTIFRPTPTEVKPVAEASLDSKAGSSEEKEVMVPAEIGNPDDAEVPEEIEIPKVRKIKHISYEELVEKMKNNHGYPLPPDMPKEPGDARQKVIIVKKKSKPTMQKTNLDSVLHRELYPPLILRKIVLVKIHAL